MQANQERRSVAEMLAIWGIWFLMIGLAIALNSCKEPGFKGKGGGGTGGLGFQKPNPGGEGGGGGSPGGGTVGGNPGGIDTSAGTSDVVTVPIRVMYNSKESISGGYTGSFLFTFKMESGEEKQGVSFNAGAKTSEAEAQVVPNICTCGKVNNIDLLITADGQRRNLQGWHQEVMTSHNPPESGSDWLNWLEKIKSKPRGPTAAYLGGFDHIFIFGQQCGSFACDERKWNNRDDTKVILECLVDQCPQKEQNFELKFVGMDP